MMMWMDCKCKCASVSVHLRSFGHLVMFSFSSIQHLACWAADTYRARFRCRWHIFWDGGPGILPKPPHPHRLPFLFVHLLTAVWFLLQGLLGGVNQVDTAAFKSVWSNIKDKYVSEVSKPPFPCVPHASMFFRHPYHSEIVHGRSFSVSSACQCFYIRTPSYNMRKSP